MIENNIPPLHPHHTRLYIGLIVVIIFAAVFFFISNKKGRVDYTPPESGTNTVRSAIDENARATLTAEEQAQKEKVLSDPALNAKAKLTTAQKKAKEAQMRALSEN